MRTNHQRGHATGDRYFWRVILPQAIGNVTCAGMVPSESTDAGSVVAEGTPCIMNTRRSRSSRWSGNALPNASCKALSDRYWADIRSAARRVRPDGTGRRRAGRGLILDQIVAHQPRILMLQHVAVIKEQAGIVLEPEQYSHAPSRHDQHGVLPSSVEVAG